MIPGFSLVPEGNYNLQLIELLVRATEPDGTVQIGIASAPPAPYYPNISIYTKLTGIFVFFPSYEVWYKVYNSKGILYDGWR
ncbi:MAG: hypothetical protein LIO79_09425 [Rikenellaceae bacterium]|nr:hypothetical protein [Rikenellaceae bacterium]